MNIQVFVAAWLLILFAYFVAGKFLKGKKRVQGLTVLTVVLIGCGAFTFVYATQTTFRWTVDAWVHPTKDYNVASNVPPLPLPEHTTRTFRSSETAVSYYSTQTRDRVAAYFQQFATAHADPATGGNSSLSAYGLTFTWNHRSYTITMSSRDGDDSKGTLFQIDSK